VGVSAVHGAGRPDGGLAGLRWHRDRRFSDHPRLPDASVRLAGGRGADPEDLARFVDLGRSQATFTGEYVLRS
jgi:hypothetical protein